VRKPGERGDRAALVLPPPPAYSAGMGKLVVAIVLIPVMAGAMVGAYFYFRRQLRRIEQKRVGGRP